eukprot:CAMPEP_0198118820 /NCGR_PEP_ID=MMETSP1442-20131203/23204_1 /TAXON_ID= /ORGANISM="Craspedostauros australis, Strain CCMP3328" /LENGTH=199 /DNA_ID=CAMNT_0043777143 /DNA_START=461 /DNA_END=1057 /DNA_ORIENTATION=+
MYDPNASTDYDPKQDGILHRLFTSCASDPRGSVHRAWGITLVFLVIYFVIAVTETINLQTYDGTIGLMIATVWAGLVHLGLGVLGTFVLKRFPTSFSVGFLLGVLVILANQNLLLFSAFMKYSFGNLRSNMAFAAIGLILCIVLVIMALMLVHFKEEVIVATPGSGDINMTTASAATNANNNTNDDSYLSYGDSTTRSA